MNFKYEFCPNAQGNEKYSDFVFDKLRKEISDWVSEERKLTGLLIFANDFCFQGFEMENGNYRDYDELFMYEFKGYMKRKTQEMLPYIVCDAISKIHAESGFSDIIEAYPFVIYIDIEDGEKNPALTIFNEFGITPDKKELEEAFKIDTKRKSFDESFTEMLNNYE